MSEVLPPEEVVESEIGADASASAMAIALDGARDDPGLREDIRGFLAKQGGLIDDQRHHLHVQLRQLRLKIFGDRVKVVLEVFTLAAFLGLLALIGIIVRDAMADHGLVIESFSASPSLAARGLTGEALADQMLGRIEAIRRTANAHSLTVSDDVRAGGADSIELVRTGEVTSGAKAVADSYAATEFKDPTFIAYDRQSDTIEVAQNGRFAVERGHWRARFRDPSGEVGGSGFYPAGWVRMDGGWRIQTEAYVRLTCKREPIC